MWGLAVAASVGWPEQSGLDGVLNEQRCDWLAQYLNNLQCICTTHAHGHVYSRFWVLEVNRTWSIKWAVQWLTNLILFTAVLLCFSSFLIAAVTLFSHLYSRVQMRSACRQKRWVVAIWPPDPDPSGFLGFCFFVFFPRLQLVEIGGFFFFLFFTGNIRFQMVVVMFCNLPHPNLIDEWGVSSGPNYKYKSI